MSQIETQKAVDPTQWDPGILEHLLELLVGAKTACGDNNNTLKCCLSIEEEQAYLDFVI